MNTLFKDNTFLTDLKVGDKVIEQHKSGLRYISEVVSIDNEKIVVKRNTNGKRYEYWTDSGSVVYPYGKKIVDLYLVQYDFPTDGTPYAPGPVASNAESLLPDYGLDA